jgi:hypothetical protein
MKTTHLVAGAVALGTAAIASAGTIQVDGIGGSATMHSAPLASAVFGGASQSNFTSDSLAAVHADLNGYGIATDNLVTFVLADVDTTGDGLADSLGFLVLIDREAPNGNFIATNSSLAMDTDADNNSLAWINDTGDDIDVRETAGGANLNAEGVFLWDDRDKGDGFAWSGLGAGDFVTFNFYENADRAGGLENFQFVSWNGAGYDVVAETELSQSNGQNLAQFGFSFTVIPLPPAAFIGLAGLALAGVARRRIVG